MTPLALSDPHVPDAPRPRGPWLRWGLLIAVWGTVAAMDATQLRVYFDLWEPQHHWVEAVQRTIPFWLFWLLYTPVVVELARRYPVERGSLGRAIPIHLTAAFALATLHAYLNTGIAFRLGWPYLYDHTFEVLLWKNLTGKMHVQVLIYAMIAGVEHALEYHRRFRERELAARELQARLAEAQLQALRTQLHPHFLFNALNSVAVLALKGDTQCAVRMVTKLSDLLRATLERSAEQEIPLSEELAVLGKYLDIEQVRFQDRLTVQIDAEDSVLGAMVPALVLQPLAENAVRHGIAETTGAGRITVRAFAADGDTLRLEVRDTGPGLPESGVTREGIGLSNTRARLARLYGPRGRLELGRGPDGVMRALVELPLRPRAAAPPVPALVAMGAE